MNKTYDVVIIGGGIIGMATAYYLSRKNVKLAVVERKYLGSGSTGRCIGGIRQQFSTPGSIRMMIESLKLFSQMEEELGRSVEFHQGGYLFLAHSPQMVEVFKKNIEIQRKENLNVLLLTPEEAKKVVPSLNTDGLLAAAYCPDDAQAFPFPVLDGYKARTEEKGGVIIMENPVVDIKKKDNFLVTLTDGSVLEAAKIVLCTGPWTRDLGMMLGLDLPMYPERHEAVITERVPRFFDPMVVDYRKDGCYFHQLISGQIIACYSPDPVVPGINEDTTIEFLPQIAWRMKRLIPELKNVAFLRNWAGCYTVTPDGNPVVDETSIKGCYVAAAMCGHGFMFGPAIGKNFAHFITTGEWQLDFSEFAINREFNKSKESMK